jgi:K+-sensing histidine kinase KdpD
LDVLNNIVEILINNDNINDFLFEYLKLVKNKLNIDSLVYYILQDETFTKTFLSGTNYNYIDLIKKEEIITLFNESNIIELNEFSKINKFYQQHFAYAILIDSDNDIYGLVLIRTDIAEAEHASLFKKTKAWFQPITNMTLNYNDYRQSIIDTCMKITSPILRSISHDVRNPIQMISILIEMLKAKDLTLEKRLNLHAKLTNGISQIDKIVTDVAYLFKKNYDINISKVSCSSFFEDIKTELTPFCKKLKINLEFSLEYKSTIEIDAEKIKDVIIKMIKYSSELVQNDGLIALSVEEIGENIKILIVDTGKGTETKILNNQKNPFFNLNDRLGTGLNFAIMHSIIEAHSGKLSVYNQEDGGTVFDIIIPKKVS